MSVEWFGNDAPGLEHFWHPVAFVHEVTADIPKRVELLGQRYVLLRSENQVIGFHDECPHRRASLSGGTIVNGTIECPYHGWRYDFAGKCVAVPALGSEAKPPMRAILQTPFGIREYAGLVWMAIKEPAEELIDWPQWESDGWDAWWLDRRETHVTAGLLTENFMDATHFAYVHRNSFGANSPSVGVDHSAREGWKLTSDFRQVTYQPGLGNVTAVVSTFLQGPFCLRMLISADSGSRAFTFFLQPCNENRTNLYLGVACTDTAGDIDRMASETAFNDRVYDEDFVVLEDYADSRLPLNPHLEISTPADANLLKYRRLLSDIVTSDWSRTMAKENEPSRIKNLSLTEE